ncbi:unnamed protein product [Owenia fusiformis]|uniref:Uncharacterized protein n=1 Tax=Owenia fusiformis TaxID=6347 RepID=A0A8J1TCB7_OWEFU|nr:unnamed protein product [Owenia fusiformis]
MCHRSFARAEREKLMQWSGSGLCYVEAGNRCPSVIGYVLPLQSNHGRYLNILTNFTIPCSGFIIGWEYQLVSNSEPFWIAVLTPLGDKLFTVRHIVEMPPIQVGFNRIESQGLEVDRGDILSVIFSDKTQKGGIANEQSKVKSPILKPDQYYDVLATGRHYFVENTNVNDVLDMNRDGVVTLTRGYAFRPLLSYDIPPKRSFTVVKVAEDSTVIDHVIRKFAVRSNKECSVLCLEEWRCLSYSYIKLAKECVLHDVDDKDDSVIQIEQGTDLYYITS